MKGLGNGLLVVRVNSCCRTSLIESVFGSESPTSAAGGGVEPVGEDGDDGKVATDEGTDGGDDDDILTSIRSVFFATGEDQPEERGPFTLPLFRGEGSPADFDDFCELGESADLGLDDVDAGSVPLSSSVTSTEGELIFKPSTAGGAFIEVWCSVVKTGLVEENSSACKDTGNSEVLFFLACELSRGIFTGAGFD